ncbi:MAG: cysteine synthase [Desulfobacterales bacterium]|jgi:cysteinyl-tRNA synthetase|nr:cysteine synthase [Desulfobacterales bacterium]
MTMEGKTILDIIGNTPLVEIKQLSPNPKVRIFAKLEYLNPGGSIKDRAAYYMIKAGEESGELTPNKMVIEATSGNTGIGLAMVCAVKGYKLLLAMSETASEERRKILKARGAEILLTPGHLGTDGAIEEVYRMAREHPDQYFVTDQFNNEANYKAHYYGTAPEIWAQTEGTITMLVATMGTTGTLMGLSRRLKEYNPAIRIVGVEPYLGHKLQGLKNLKEAYCPGIFEKSRLDSKVNVEDEPAYEMARQLARKEGIFVGMSSGAAMVVAREQAAVMSEGIIVVIFPDGGERYLSTSLFAEKDKVDLILFDTLRREKAWFRPIQPEKVTLFTCGPTAHTRMHLGEYRRLVFADLLGRYFSYRGYEVSHVVHVTDLDDKTIQDAEKAGTSLEAFTRQQLEDYQRNLTLLTIHSNVKHPRTSENIEDMIHLAERLATKGYAYEKLRSLYFDISRFSGYGKLSGIDIYKIKLGATVDLDEYEKDNPRDFTLMKRITLSELKKGLFFKTQWGNARPSWHIQSTAIAMKYLGNNFDIYISSRELIFPHNENEIALSEALTGKPMANYWLHCEQVRVDGKKVGDTARMTLNGLTELGYSGREIRYWLLSSHYRKPILFSIKQLESTRRSLGRLDACIHSLESITAGQPYLELNQLLYDLKQGFVSAMDMDINISAAIASLFKVVKKINRLIAEGRIDPTDAEKILDCFQGINSVLQIFDFSRPRNDAHIQSLIQAREAARKEKNWNLADKLRDELAALNICVQDQKV